MNKSNKAQKAWEIIRALEAGPNKEKLHKATGDCTTIVRNAWARAGWFGKGSPFWGGEDYLDRTSAMRAIIEVCDEFNRTKDLLEAESRVQ